MPTKKKYVFQYFVFLWTLDIKLNYTTFYVPGSSQSQKYHFRTLFPKWLNRKDKLHEFC